MPRDRGTLDRAVDELKQIRDELELQLHLASADARNEWEKLETRWNELRGKLEVVGDAADETAGNVGEALDRVASELKKGYQRIRDLL